MCKNVLIFLMGLYALMATAGGPEPGVWQEVGDVPSFPDGQAQITRGQGLLTNIRGSTSAADPRNAYCIKITEPANFVATTDSNVIATAFTGFDTRLFLFNKQGQPLLFNDDTPPSASPFASTLRSETTDGSGFELTQTGEYILVVAGFADRPLDNIANQLFSEQAELIHAPIPNSNKFAFWQNNSPVTGFYDIALQGVSFCQDQLDVVGTGFQLPSDTQVCSGTFSGFNQCNNTSIDSGKEAVSTAYLNNDRHLDVVFDGFLVPPTVCLGDGQGGYQSCQVLDIGTNNTDDALIGDINNDHFNDVVFLGVGENHRVCLGNGSGTFVSCTELQHSDTSGNGALALMDGDSHLDLVFTTFSDVRVCAGDGQGGFVACQTNIVETSQIIIADVNNDSMNDIVGASLSANNGNQVCINDGNNQFTCSNISNQTNSTVGVDAADLNGDGNVDVVFANSNIGGPGINQACLGDGNGAFNCSDVSGVEGDYDAVKLGLINDDNAVDVVFAGSDFVRVCYGNGTVSGDGTFIDCFNDSSLDFADMELAELGQYQLNAWQEVADAQTYPDGQAQVTRGQGPLDVIRGETATGTDSRDAYCIKITNPQDFRATTDANSNNAASATFDTRLFLFDQQGKPVLFNDDTPPSAEPFASTLSGLTTDGSGFELNKSAEYTLIVAGFSDDPVDNLATNLFSQDATLIHAPIPNSNKFATWENSNPQTGAYEVTLRGATYCQNQLDIVGTGDDIFGSISQLCTGDGNGGFGNCNDQSIASEKDAIVTGYINDDAHLDVVFDQHLNDLPTVCLGDGVGGYSTCAVLDVGTNETSLPVLGDINNDQNTDLILGNPQGDFKLCLGDGNGFFNCQDWPSNEIVFDVKLALMNNDSHLDLVISRFDSVGSSNNGVEVCFGDGVGGFSNCVLNSVDAVDLAIADINNDGTNDVLTSFEGDTKKACFNDGNGALNCFDIDAEMTDNFSLATGDVNNDGSIDAVFTEINLFGGPPGLNRVCLNDGNGAFDCNPVSGVSGSYKDVALVLLNNDEALDLIFTGNNGVGGNPLVRTCLGNGDGTFSDCSNDEDLPFSKIALGEFGGSQVNDDDIIFANGFE